MQYLHPSFHHYEVKLKVEYNYAIISFKTQNFSWISYVLGNTSIQHEGIVETWSIAIPVQPHHNWPWVCNTFIHSLVEIESLINMT
jgi:hypothetical protein